MKRFGGGLKERVYIMHRVCMARIAVMSGQCFDLSAFFAGAGACLARANAMRHTVAPRMKVSAEADNRGMLTGCCFSASCNPGRGKCS